MNVTMFNMGSNKGSSPFAGNLTVLKKPAMKSSQEKAGRMQKAAGKIEFWENQKESLKDMQHVLDEAKEIGEKIAEEAEKFEPKTAEEKLEDMVEEALGTDEEKGELTEMTEDILLEELLLSEEELTESLTETDMQEVLLRETPENADYLSEAVSDSVSESMPESAFAQEWLKSQRAGYKRINMLI